MCKQNRVNAFRYVTTLATIEKFYTPFRLGQIWRGFSTAQEQERPNPELPYTAQFVLEKHLPPRRGIKLLAAAKTSGVIEEKDFGESLAVLESSLLNSFRLEV